MEDTLISTLINLPPLTAVASSLLVREADKPLVWNEQQRRLNCSAVEHLFSAAAELHNVTGSERCCMQQTWLASYQQQLLGSSCSLVSSQLQLQLLLSNFPCFQPGKTPWLNWSANMNWAGLSVGRTFYSWVRTKLRMLEPIGLCQSMRGSYYIGLYCNIAQILEFRDRSMPSWW